MRLVMFNPVELRFQSRPFDADSSRKLILKRQSLALSFESIENGRGRRLVRGHKSNPF